MDKLKMGILLITIGVFMLLNTFNLVSDNIFLYLLSAGFLITYIMLGARKHYRNIGFLIPASILTSIALSNDLQRIYFIDNLGNGVFYLLLGLAFLIILIHSSAFENWDWPLYPGGSLIVFGLFVIFLDKSKYMQNLNYLNYIIPIILIALGSLFIYLRQNNR
jgi:hypothetical protein